MVLLGVRRPTQRVVAHGCQVDANECAGCWRQPHTQYQAMHVQTQPTLEPRYTPKSVPMEVYSARMAAKGQVKINVSGDGAAKVLGNGGGRGRQQTAADRSSSRWGCSGGAAVT